MYNTTVKYSSGYNELFLFYFMLLKNISFKHLEHTNKKGKVLKDIIIEAQKTNHNKEIVILEECLSFCEQAAVVEEEGDKELTLWWVQMKWERCH